jgi:hypothetical protein
MFMKVVAETDSKAPGGPRSIVRAILRAPLALVAEGDEEPVSIF